MQLEGRARGREIQDMTLVPDAIRYRASQLRMNAQATTSSGYKTFFRALQACSGNVTAMTKVARDFIGAGLLAGAVVNPDVFSATAEKTVSFFAKLESMKTEREFSGFPRQPRPTKQPTASSGGGQHHQADYNDPFLKLANEMFVAYTDWSGGMPMSVEGNNNAQSYHGREGVPPSMALSMEKYNPQPYRGEKGVQPSMGEATFRQPDHGSNGYYLSPEGGWAGSIAEATFRQADHGSNGYYLSPEEGWAASMRGSYAGGADARSLSYGGDYHHGLTPYTTPCNAGGADARSFSYGGDYHHGLTPYTTPCNNYTVNNGPMVCGFCLDSACRCYHPQQHAGNMHFQPPPLLSGYTMANTEISAPSTSTAITAAAPASEYRPSVLTCPGQHGLTSWATLTHGYPCHFCGGVIASGVPVLSCSLCQVYACPSCVWMHHNTVS